MIYLFKLNKSIEFYRKKSLHDKMKKRGGNLFMKLSNTLKEWGGVTKLFHWGMFLLIIIQYTFAYTMLEMSPSDQKWMLFKWHKELGLTLLLLVFFRFWWRQYNLVPKDSEKAPRWSHILSKINIWTLYILMFVFPLTGLLMFILGGHPVDYFNLFTIPALINDKDNVYAAFFLTAHIRISYALYVFVGLHILGAFYHHFIIRDKVLSRMLPHI